MTAQVLFSAVAAGLLGGSGALLPTLAVALLYDHGRYLPLWLPSLGVGGAYMLHALWHAGLPVPLCLLVVASASILLALAIHFLLLVPFINRDDSLSLLLIGIGLGEMFQGFGSLYGDGMSQHYPESVLGMSTFTPTLGIAVFWADTASLMLGAAALTALWIFLTQTRAGLEARAVIANRDLARSTGLRVRRVDVILIAVAAVAMVSGVVIRGARNDLQPGMMLYPGLTAVVACVAAGPGRRSLALLIALGLEVATQVVGAFPAISTAQRAVPFVLPVLLLATRSFAGRSAARSHPA